MGALFAVEPLLPPETGGETPEAWEAAAAALGRAAERAAAAGSPALGAYLEIAGGALLSGEVGELEAAWMAAGSEPFVVILGPAGAGGDGEPPIHHLEIGIPDGAEHRWVDPLLERMADFERWLPLEAEHRSGPENLRASIVVANAVLRGGSLAGSSGPGQYLPFDRGLRESLGRRDVFWKNLAAEAWYANEVRFVAERSLVEGQRELATAGAHLRFYATRFAMYQLGPQGVWTEAGRVSLREHFGESWGPLQVLKADVLAILAHEWLIEQGLQPAETSGENLAMAITMAFLGAAEELEAHRRAGLVALGTLARRGAMRLDPSGTWAFEPERVRAVLRELAAEVFAIHASGDRERAEALLARYARPAKAIDGTLRKLTERPPWRVPVEYVVRGL